MLPAHDYLVANPHAWQNDGLRADKHLVTDDHRRNARKVKRGLSRSIVRQDVATRGDGHVVAHANQEAVPPVDDNAEHHLEVLAMREAELLQLLDGLISANLREGGSP